MLLLLLLRLLLLLLAAIFRASWPERAVDSVPLLLPVAP
jgi:hypothetical protein